MIFLLIGKYALPSYTQFDTFLNIGSVVEGVAVFIVFIHLNTNIWILYSGNCPAVLFVFNSQRLLPSLLLPDMIS
jgi:hypothetical protein